MDDSQVTLRPGSAAPLAAMLLIGYTALTSCSANTGDAEEIVLQASEGPVGSLHAHDPDHSIPKHHRGRPPRSAGEQAPKLVELAYQPYSRTKTAPLVDRMRPGLADASGREEPRYTAALDHMSRNPLAGQQLGSTGGQQLQLGGVGNSASIHPPKHSKLTVHRSPFTSAPHHAHFSAEDPGTHDSGLENARIEWDARTLSGAPIDGKVGGPEFGVVFEEAGEYIVTLRVKFAEENTWRESAVPISVDAPQYQAECWLDPSSTTNGSGTVLHPFNNWASATTYIENHWSGGATSEHCIHIRRDTRATTNSSWNIGLTPMPGRLVYKPYGSGARPQILHGNGRFVTTHNDTAFAAVSLDISGDATPGTFMFASHITPGSGANGHNTIFVDCKIHECGAGFYFNDVGVSTAAQVEAGEFDFVAVKNCKTGSVFQTHTLATRSRFVLFQGNYWDSVQNEYGQRFNHIQYADFRGNEHERAMANASIFRIHSNLLDAETQRISITDCVFHDETWIGPKAGQSHTPYPMRHIWIERCRVDATGRTWALAAFATERLVIRNCWVRGLGSCINHRPEAGTTVATNWTIEGNSMISEQTSGATGRGWRATVATLTDVTFRNNLLHMPNLTGPCYFFSVDNAQDSRVVLAECDGNQFSAPGGTRRWAAGFLQGGQTLADWQMNTGLALRSSDAAFAAFADPTGTPFDLSIGANSSAINGAVPANGMFVDVYGRSRVDPTDVGAHDRDGVPH